MIRPDSIRREMTKRTITSVTLKAALLSNYFVVEPRSGPTTVNPIIVPRLAKPLNGTL
jgi:hypothetical protein